MPATASATPCWRAPRASSTGARALLDAVAIAPPRAELWLLEALAGERPRPTSTSASPRGCCAPAATRSRFRHEIARVAVEEALPPHRRLALHRRALSALADATRRRLDLARLAHHAEAAGDARGGAALRAGRRRARGRRSARTARRPRSSPGRCGSPTRSRASERGRAARAALVRVLPDRRIGDAIDARRRALDRAPRPRRPPARGRRASLALAARLVRRATAQTAEAEGRRRSSCSRNSRPGRELAMAYSNMAQLRMLASDVAGARRLGRTRDRARRAARRDRDPRPRAQQRRRGRASRRLLGGAGEARAQPGAGARGRARGARRPRVHATSPRPRSTRATTRSATATSTRGSTYCRERDLDSWRLYMTGWRARSQLDQGRWDDAAAGAADGARPSATSRRRAGSRRSLVLGRLHARRGDADPWTAARRGARARAGDG